MNRFLIPIVKFPQRLWDFVRSPKRLRNMAARLAEAGAGIGVFYLLGPTWYSVLAAFLTEYVLYEFFLEPAGFAGHYFERDARDGETFKHP